MIGRQHAVVYALDSGKELWRLRGLTGQSTPSPVAADGLLYLATGSQGESNRPVFAVKPGASGDISLAKGEDHNAFVAWIHPRASAYTSSPLVYRGRMYVVNDNGILTVFDAATGKEIYKARAGGSGNTFSASPWAADGQGLPAERGWPHVRDRGRRQIRGVGEEQPRRDEPGLAGAGAGCAVHADADEAVSHRRSPGASAGLNGRAPALFLGDSRRRLEPRGSVQDADSAGVALHGRRTRPRPGTIVAAADRDLQAQPDLRHQRAGL